MSVCKGCGDQTGTCTCRDEKMGVNTFTNLFGFIAPPLPALPQDRRRVMVRRPKEPRDFRACRPDRNARCEHLREPVLVG